MAKNETVKKFNFDDFTKLEISYRRGDTTSLYVHISKKGFRIRFSKAIAEQWNLVAGDRVDIYENGSVIAVKKSPVGCLTVRGTSTADLGITSVSAYLAFAVATPAQNKGETKFKASLEEDILFVDMGTPYLFAKRATSGEGRSESCLA